MAERIRQLTGVYSKRPPANHTTIQSRLQRLFVWLFCATSGGRFWPPRSPFPNNLLGCETHEPRGFRTLPGQSLCIGNAYSRTKPCRSQVKSLSSLA